MKKPFPLVMRGFNILIIRVILWSALFKVSFNIKKISEIKTLIILWKGDRKCIDRDNDRERETRERENICVYSRVNTTYF